MAGATINLDFEAKNIHNMPYFDEGIKLSQVVGIYFITRINSEKPIEEARHGLEMLQTGETSIPTDELVEYFKTVVKQHPSMENYLKYQIIDKFIAQ